MDGGRVIENGDVFEVFSTPQNPSSQRFVATVVKGIPSPAELSVLRERHDGRIVTISFRDGDASQAAVFVGSRAPASSSSSSTAASTTSRDARSGTSRSAIRGADDAIDAALARITARVEVTEAA